MSHSGGPVEGAATSPNWLIASHVSGDGVQIVDKVEARTRQGADIVAMVLEALGIVVVCLLAVYAHSTTIGVTEDVQAATAFLASFLQVVVSVLGGIVTLVMPIAILVELALRRSFRSMVEAVSAALLAAAVAYGIGLILEGFPAASLTRSLTITVDGVPGAAVAPTVTALAAMLTVIGPRTKRRTAPLAWGLMWFELGVEVITAKATLPSAIITVLLGMVIGSAVRYVSGVQPERAQGEQLIAGVRRAGIDPVLLVRVVEGEARDAARRLVPAEVAASSQDDLSLALAATSDDRVYAAFGADGGRWDVLAMDSDRQVVGMLAQLWQTIRLRSVERRAVVSLRQAAERSALLAYSARAAGVRTPGLIGIGERGSSMMLVQDHQDGLTSLARTPTDEIPDAALNSVWRGLSRAHAAGLAHRTLTADCILFAAGVQANANAWIVGWDNGDVASSDLARRMDNAQLLAALALKVGAERAVASAARVLSSEELAATAPLLQTIALPRRTRIHAKEQRDVMDATRTALLEHAPTAEQEPVRLVRFGLRTIVMITLAAVAGFVVLTTLNFNDIVAAFQSASPVWIVVCFVLSLLTYLGSTLALIGFSPTKLPFGRVLVLQIAGSVIALVAPGGVGPAALNLRFLTKKKMSRPLAVATVALVQVLLFVTTIILLLLIALLTGDMGAFSQVPTTAILIVIAVLAVIGLALLIPGLRAWVWDKVGPMLMQVWPRLVWVLGQPRKLVMGLGGNFLITIGFVAAFWAALHAFGVDDIPLTSVAIIYLAGNSVGSLVPTPGGLGTVELALIGGLTTIGGVQGAVATSVVVLFRALCYWARIPLGYVAMRSLSRHDEI